MARVTAVPFPVLSLRGGPSPSSLDLQIDGHEIAKSTDLRLVLGMGVNDVVRATWSQFIKPDIQVELGKQFYHVAVNGIDHGIVEATADSVWQALVDCARQLELKAKAPSSE